MVGSTGGLGGERGVVGQPRPLSHARRNTEQVMLWDSQGWVIEKLLLSMVSISASLFHFG